MKQLIFLFIIAMMLVTKNSTAQNNDTVAINNCLPIIGPNIKMPFAEFKLYECVKSGFKDTGNNFSIQQFNIYFGDAYFPNVVTGSITGSNLSILKSYINRCGPGTKIGFDKIIIKTPTGTREMQGRVIVLY